MEGGRGDWKEKKPRSDRRGKARDLKQSNNGLVELIPGEVLESTEEQQVLSNRQILDQDRFLYHKSMKRYYIHCSAMDMELT